MRPQTGKKFFTIFCVFVSIGFYFWFIVYSEYGVKKYLSLKQQFLEKEKLVKKELEKFEKEKIQQDLYLKSSFAKEKIAREDLLLSGTNEIVYVFDNEPTKRL
jgi:cell division protein FtsB